MGWEDLQSPKRLQERAEQEQGRVVALEKACIQALKGANQQPLKAMLKARAHSMSYRPGITPEQVAFDEGQRSLALQILKLAGELS